MKITYSLLLAFVILFTGTTYAAAPTVEEVEQTISAGEYAKAKTQLREVLKENPDSIVASKYLLEIVRIENARDNQPSVEYRLYDEQLKRLLADKSKRDFMDVFIPFLKAMVVILLFALMGVVVRFGGKFAKKWFKNQRKKAKALRKEQELEEQCHQLERDLISLAVTLDNAMIRSIKQPNIHETLEDLMNDNFDALACVKSRDFNRAKVNAHIRNAKDYLRNICGEDI